VTLTLICPEVPHERIFTKLGKNVPLVDVINCDKFCDNLFKGLTLQEVKFPFFPTGLRCRRYNSATLLCNMWIPCRIRLQLVKGSA